MQVGRLLKVLQEIHRNIALRTITPNDWLALEQQIHEIADLDAAHPVRAAVVYAGRCAIRTRQIDSFPTHTNSWIAYADLVAIPSEYRSDNIDTWVKRLDRDEIYPPSNCPCRDAWEIEKIAVAGHIGILRKHRRFRHLSEKNWTKILDDHCAKQLLATYHPEKYTCAVDAAHALALGGHFDRLGYDTQSNDVILSREAVLTPYSHRFAWSSRPQPERLAALQLANRYGMLSMVPDYPKRDDDVGNMNLALTGFTPAATPPELAAAAYKELSAPFQFDVIEKDPIHNAWMRELAQAYIHKNLRQKQLTQGPRSPG